MWLFYLHLEMGEGLYVIVNFSLPFCKSNLKCEKGLTSGLES